MEIGGVNRFRGVFGSPKACHLPFPWVAHVASNWLQASKFQVKGLKPDEPGNQALG